MKRFLIPLLFLLGCASTQQTGGSTPPGMVIDHDTVRIITHDTVAIYDSLLLILHDTVHVHDTTQLPQPPPIIDTLLLTDTVRGPPVHDTIAPIILRPDSGKYVIWLTPIAGADNQPQIQAAINYCNDNPGYMVGLRHGLYLIYSPIIGAKIVNGVYKQFSFVLFGEFSAKNTPDQYLTIIAPQYWDKPAIALELCKGVRISDIALQGGYMMAANFNITQVMGYRPDQWKDGVCTFGRTNPYAGIAIDPFSDSTNYDGNIYQMYAGLHQWYLPGMNRSGSTDVQIINCKIMQFVVGVVVTPSFQANGELVNVTNSQIGNCYIAYAWTQAQSKQNWVRDLMVWSSCHTVLDGMSFGKQHGDGAYAPNVDGISIAGQVNRLIQAYAYAFGMTIANVYAEQIGSIGSTGLNPYEPTVFVNCIFDWACQDGLPSQDFWYEGRFVRFDNCEFRNYNGDTTCRFIMNADHCIFNGGSVGLPPFLLNDWGNPPIMREVMVFYGDFYGHDWLSINNYDSTYIVSQGLVRITAGYTGYFDGGNLSTLVPGDLLITQAQNINGGIDNIQGTQWNTHTPVGYVTQVVGGRVYFKRIGVSIQDSVIYPIFVCKYKTGFRQ